MSLPPQAPVPQAPDDDGVAPPPAMPVQSTIYFTPDGRVQFGALFEALVPVARALDPSMALPAPPPAADE